MQHIARHLRIPGIEPVAIESVKFLGPKYRSSLARAAKKASLIDTITTHRLHAARQGDLLLFQDKLPGMAEVGGYSAHLTLENMDDLGNFVLGATRHESSRGVRFGQLLFEHPDRNPVHEYVGVKPTVVERAVRETVVAELLNANHKDTGLKTYKPLGFVKMGDKTVSLLTQFAPNTLTFDNVLWDEPEKVSEGQVADALAKSATTLATLHAAFQISHGDAQPKNMAWNNDTDKPWGVDFEDSKRHVGASAWDFEDSAETDLAVLMLFQPTMRSKDMFELVADKYTNQFREISGDERRVPVMKDIIVRMQNRKLQPLPKTERNK